MAITLAILSTVLAGCGDSPESDDNAGGSSPEALSTAQHNEGGAGGRGGVDAVRAVFRKTAYYPWYQNCMIKQMETRLTPDEVEEINDQTDAARVRGLEFSKLAKHCLPGPGQRKINFNASPSALNRVRLGVGSSMRALALSEGANNAVATCAFRFGRNASEPDIRSLTEGPKSAAEKVVSRMFFRCVAAG